MKTEIFLAWRYLFRGSARHLSFISIIACVGIALGIGTLIIVISVMNGFDRDLTERLLRFNYHLTIESFNEEKLRQVQKEIQSWDEVNEATVFLQTQVFAQFNSYIMPLLVKGIDFSNSREQDRFKNYIISQQAEEGVWIGEGIQKKYFVEDFLKFYPLKKKLELQQMPVRGVFKVGLYDIDNNMIIADFDVAKELSPNYAMFVGARISDPYSAAMVKKKIDERYPHEVFVDTWMNSNQLLFSALKLEKIAMFVILSLIVIVASFNIFGSLTVKVVEKTKDIGILKSLGFTNRMIMAIFSLQGLALGILGVALGTFLGIGICLVLQHYPFIKLPEQIYALQYLPVTIQARDTVMIVGVGIIIAFVSSLIPAVKASNLTVCEALRYE